MMTDKGTFIINGTERVVVVSQLVRSPGVIFQPGERFRLRNLSSTSWSPAPSTPTAASGSSSTSSRSRAGPDGRAPASPASVACRCSCCCGRSATTTPTPRLPRPAFVRHFDFLEGQWEKDKEIAPTQEEAIIEIYKRARPGEPPPRRTRRNYFNNAFFEPRRYDLSRVGRYKLNRKLGPEIERLQEQFPQLAGLARRAGPRPAGAQPLRGPGRHHLPAQPGRRHPGYRLDDQDHFANRASARSAS